MSVLSIQLISTRTWLTDTDGPERIDFVLDTIATNLSAIVSTWYEHPHIVELLNAFRRVR